MSNVPVGSNFEGRVVVAKTMVKKNTRYWHSIWEQVCHKGTIHTDRMKWVCICKQDAKLIGSDIIRLQVTTNFINRRQSMQLILPNYTCIIRNVLNLIKINSVTRFVQNNFSTTFSKFLCVSIFIETRTVKDRHLKPGCCRNYIYRRTVQQLMLVLTFHHIIYKRGQLHTFLPFIQAVVFAAAVGCQQTHHTSVNLHNSIYYDLIYFFYHSLIRSIIFCSGQLAGYKHIKQA